MMYEVEISTPTKTLASVLLPTYEQAEYVAYEECRQVAESMQMGYRWFRREHGLYVVVKRDGSVALTVNIFEVSVPNNAFSITG